MAGNNVWGAAAQLLSVGTVLVAAIVLGYAGGSYLDSKLKSEPWFMLIGVILGTAAGFVNLWRTVKRLK